MLDGKVLVQQNKLGKSNEANNTVMNIIGAGIIRNCQIFLEDVVKSLSWVDEIVICNDHSTDATDKILSSLRATSPVKIAEIRPWFSGTMLSVDCKGNRNIEREQQIRNGFLEKIFCDFSPDAVVLFDGDELISSALKPHIVNVINSKQFDSIAFTCHHLFDKELYLHFFENVWNSMYMVDPHLRVLTRFESYQMGEWAEVPDCMLKPNSNTLCLDGPYHYHLKYVKQLALPNFSLRFLPKNFTSEDATPYLRPHRFPFPPDLIDIIEKYI